MPYTIPHNRSQCITIGRTGVHNTQLSLHTMHMMFCQSQAVFTLFDTIGGFGILGVSIIIILYNTLSLYTIMSCGYSCIRYGFHIADFVWVWFGFFAGVTWRFFADAVVIKKGQLLDPVTYIRICR